MLGLHRHGQIRAVRLAARPLLPSRPRWSFRPPRQLGCLHGTGIHRKRQESQHKDEKRKQSSQEKSTEEKPSVPHPKARQSLRRVGMEAQLSKQIIQDKGGLRIVDPDLETKKVTAYCAAEQYNIFMAARIVEADGFDIDPCGTGLYPQVIHIQAPIQASDPSESDAERSHGDIFIFPSGTVVAWNVPERTALRLVERILPPAAVNPDSRRIDMEKEDLEYIEDPTKERGSIVGDTIILGTKHESDRRTNGESSSSGEADAPYGREATFAKIAFSSGLARSTKLAVLERLTESAFESTRSIPTIMSRGTPLPVNRPYALRRFFEILGFGSRLPFTRAFILRKTGELLSIRAQLNLYSELTDSIPDLFWDSRHELGLEGYYDQVGRALDVGVRIRVLNGKLDYAQEIASVLRETLSERHNLRLEWGIILLIAIEVVFELLRVGKEWMGRHDPESVEELARKWLKQNVKADGKA